MLSATAYAMTFPAPAHGLDFRPRPGSADLDCWLALPRRISDDRPPLVAVHGLRRDARQQAELFAEQANALGRPVIAPLFDVDRWPRYQQAIRRGRADLALLALMARLRREGIWRTPQFDLFGFSGGAQFAHRFAMLHPETVSRLTTASAGWYTFPDTTRFPHGLSPWPGEGDPWAAVTGDKIKRFLSIPIQVCVGADDHMRDRNTRSDPVIDAQQGRHRLARAVNWAKALKQAARRHGLTPRISFIALSACGHDFGQCVQCGGLDRIVISGKDGNDVPSPGTASLSGRQPANCATCQRLCGIRSRFQDPAS